jgi:hypothetical protein
LVVARIGGDQALEVFAGYESAGSVGIGDLVPVEVGFRGDVRCRCRIASSSAARASAVIAATFASERPSEVSATACVLIEIMAAARMIGNILISLLLHIHLFGAVRVDIGFKPFDAIQGDFMIPVSFTTGFVII